MEKMTYVSALTYAIENGNLPEAVKEKLSALAVQQGKRSGAEHKTTQQTLNEGYKTLIVEFLADGEKRTITEMVKLINWGEGVEMSTNRCSALVRQLKLEGIVIRVEDKRKAYFYLAPLSDNTK